MERRITGSLFLSAAALQKRDETTSESQHTSILGYKPTNWATAVATIVAVIIALAQTRRMWQYGGKYMLAMTIGAYIYAVGILLRFVVRSNPNSVMIYAVQNALVTLSPCGFIAAEYVLLGRMARWLGCAHHLLVPARWIALIFVLSDVFTFLIQGSGGGLAATGGDSAKMGAKLFLIGLIIQLISFIIFTVVFMHFIWRVKKFESALWHKDSRSGWWHDWRTLAGALMFSCIGVIIRSVYRTAELGEGFRGHLSTTEWYFYAFDVIPLFIAVGIYVPIWPAKFFPDGMPPVQGSVDTLPLSEGGKAQVEYGRLMSRGSPDPNAYPRRV